MSRSNARSRALRRRPSRTIPATITAAALTAIGVLTAIAAISRLVEGRWPTQATGAASTVAASTWGSPAVLVAGALLALIGLVLLLAGIKLGPFKTTPLAAAGSGTVEDTDFVISTRSMARLAATRADQVDGVDKVSASASSRRVHLQVTTTSEQTDQIRQQVRDGVTDQLAATGVTPAPRVTATVRTKGI